MDINKGKTGLFSGKKAQCSTQEFLDGVITLHCNWPAFKAARLKLWPPTEDPVTKAVNLAVLANDGNY